MDNEKACGHAEEQKLTRRSKHIRLNYHHVRDAVAKGWLKMEWVPGAKQVADVLTKRVHRPVFEGLRARILWPPTTKRSTPTDNAALEWE